MNPAVTHCLRGHEYTPENTQIKQNGTRRCRTCLQQASMARPRKGRYGLTGKARPLAERFWEKNSRWDTG